jgi:hypothetical protein
MRVRICIICIIYVFLIYGCKSFHYLKNNESNSFKGIIKFNGNELYSIKFKAKFDTLFNISIKLYNYLGFKIGNFKLNNDSLIIENIFDSSYRNSIYEFYKKTNDEIDIKKFLKNLLCENIFDQKVNYSKGLNCNRFLFSKNIINVYSRECKFFFTLQKINNNKYEFILLNNEKIEFFLKKD